MNTPTLHGATTNSASAALAERWSRLAATGSYAGFFAAACWIALGVESIVRPQQQNYRDLFWMIPFGLMPSRSFSYTRCSVLRDTSSGSGFIW